MSETRGFGVGGTLHIVVNNQVGFTISDPRDLRSTLYCSTIAKMVHAPIFHVNGDDPDAVQHVMRIACDFRRKFKRDVVMPMIRRHKEMFPAMQRRGATDLSHPVSGHAIASPAPRRPVKKYSGTGRNERCPCGSGKKYKVCCGR